MNDALRFFIDAFIRGSAVLLRFAMFLRLRTHRWNQTRLRRKYRIWSAPISGYEDQRLSNRPKAVYAFTSGSTKDPKKIPYDRMRLFRTQFVFIDTFWRYLAETPLKNRSIFIFSSMKPDDSLTSLLLQKSKPPSYLVGLHAPHLAQNHGSVREAARQYGETPVRFWILAVSNPALIYATNPSTIAAFLHEIHENWDASRRVAGAGALREIQKRIAARGAEERLQKIANSPRPLAIAEMFPALGAFACWDGGYVAPFIEQIRQYLPESRYRHLPMYSMSTETIETIAVTGRGAPMFMPLAPGVLYEFVEEGMADLSGSLLMSHELRQGVRYAMVVSDGYGLRRYQTDDLFECVAVSDGVPDLRFVQRRNLGYSFTGEKLTADQLKLAYQFVESRYPELRRHGFLTCFPSRSPVPRYRLIYVRSSEGAAPHPAIAAMVESKLCEFNGEFKSKIESRRLGRMKLEVLTLSDFIRRASGPEAQFKFLPLYTKLWETQTISAVSGL